jgi:hypothetical protein
MRPLTSFEIATLNIAEVGCYVLGVAIFFKICRDVSRIDGAPTINDWNTTRPFYPLNIFRAHRANFTSSWLVPLYWFLALAFLGVALIFQIHQTSPNGLTNLLLAITGCGAAALLVRNKFAKR